ncbi:hypothetical protein B0H14DRAFT_3518237 [Mycena olivaceomarginata]|nr:hypothetical protein B0H14DRAFT_3518237 [Mycena olivaceomarginata]
MRRSEKIKRDVHWQRCRERKNIELTVLGAAPAYSAFSVSASTSTLDAHPPFCGQQDARTSTLGLQQRHDEAA